jgi:hypothetical protein
MASTYSTNLALELIGTGEQSGTWGTTTNTNLGTLLEQAISGYVTQAITDGSGANTTITIPNGTTGVARNMFIEMTGALTFATTSLIVPANKKMYFIFNNTSGGFAVTVKVSGQTGILVPNGKKVILTCNGTDIVEAHTAIVGNATMGGTLGVTGATTAAAINASGLVAMAGAATVGTTLGVTGITTVAAGSAAAPSIVSTTGTADTGMYFPGADILGFATAGAQVGQFTAGGYLKASPDPAILFNATDACHEFIGNSASIGAVRIRSQSATFAGTAALVYVDRAASTLFNLLDMQSGTVSKFLVDGTGNTTISGTVQPTLSLAKTNATATTWKIYNNGNLVFYDGTNVPLYFIGANSTFGGAVTVTGTLSTTGDIYTTAWTNYSGTTTVGGFSSSTTTVVWYKKVGKTVHVLFYLSGTSNATTVTFTVPQTISMPATVRVSGGSVTDNGTGLAPPCAISIPTGGSTITVYKDLITNSFTSSGSKLVSGQFWFEASA